LFVCVCVCVWVGVCVVVVCVCVCVCVCVSLLWAASSKVMLLKNKSDLSLIIYGFTLRRLLAR